VQKILVTGGAGFFGSSIALRLRAEHPDTRIIAADNLHRRGSELNLARLKSRDIEFVHADIRSVDDMRMDDLDVIVECSAEPSAMAGRNGDVRYLLDTNLGGAINCLELARRNRAGIIFVSTSRVYPFDRINALPLVVEGERFVLERGRPLPPGISGAGLTADFGLPGRRTLYGASKLAAELIVQEFADVYDVPALILRFGVIAGPWQMGKVDQGFVALWVARHLAGGGLSYCGYGGLGHQVRDVLHVEDAVGLVVTGLSRLGSFRGEIFNAGGGADGAISLAEMTALCRAVTGRSISLGADAATRPGDIPWYVTDNAAVTAALSWAPSRSVRDVVTDTFDWLCQNREALSAIIG
jgi:CDP-paratose 2-epimerase